MGSPLGPTLGDAFLVSFKKNWLQTFPSDFKSHYYRRYVDDIFVLFISPKHLEAFRNFLNDQHANMSFTTENENKTEYPFLMYRLFVKIKHLPLLATINLPLVEFIHSLIGASDYAQVGLNYTLS